MVILVCYIFTHITKCFICDINGMLAHMPGLHTLMYIERFCQWGCVNICCYICYIIGINWLPYVDVTYTT